MRGPRLYVPAIEANCHYSERALKAILALSCRSIQKQSSSCANVISVPHPHPLEKRSDKHSKPYFVCDSCGIQFFVRKKHGIERLHRLLKAAGTNATFFREAAHRVFEVEALLSEIDGTKAQIKKVEGEIGFLFPDEEKIRACDALKIRLNNLVNQFEEFCKEET